ncbi:CASP-like protein 1D1 [Punica granatum]|uniref:CASP-like protein n=2 Tax=Punica granatum TaxID=22663 RepID=A0A2I0I5P8_PUNGR|nr:CASP-like protein 1D1 [Punica granatum]PKI39308.1 hypothetical protein CRG98_040294 [Punica granatum]
MASTEKAADPEAAKEGHPLKPEARPPPPPPSRSLVDVFATVDVGLRVVLFASTLTAVLVMVTGKQTELSGVPIPVPVEAKFNNSPAFIYFVVALSVACLYSIITILASISVILKPAFSLSFILFFVIWDVVMLGLVASATGTAGGVAYIGHKGNSHTKWMKICNVYDKFCQHLAGSIAVSLFASIVLVLLIIFSVFFLHKKIPK